MSKLRPRNDLEAELNVQISLGTITSLESAIDSGLRPALEYGAQTLFDNVRKRVANYTNLPEDIVQYLANDRIPKIVETIYKIHFDKLTSEQKEKFFVDATNIFTTYERWSDPYSTYSYLCRNIFIEAIKNQNESLAIHTWIDTGLIKKMSPDLDRISFEIIKNFPNLLRTVHEHYPSDFTRIFHPDVEIRKEVLTRIFDKKDFVRIEQLINKCTFTYSGFVHSQQRLSKTAYAEEIQKLFVDDSDESIREMLINNTTIRNVLRLIVDKETSPKLKEIATKKLQKLEARNKYSKAYNRQKKNKPRVVTNSQ